MQMVINILDSGLKIKNMDKESLSCLTDKIIKERLLKEN